MTWIIDGHQDIACEAILHCRDYKRPVAAARAAEPDDPTNRITLGYPEYREAGIGIIFSTVFLEKIADGPDDPIPAVQYRNGDEFHRAALAQLDFYRRWNDDPDGKFRLLRTRAEYDALVSALDQGEPAPIGLVPLMEGTEGLRSFSDLDEYIEAGLRIVGPVWAGGRWCGGGMNDPSDGFTAAGYDLLNALSGRGLILDISHMNKKSAETAIERYDGVVIASHCNCISLLRRPRNQRLLHDDTIRLMIERGGVIGVVPCNFFLNSEWRTGDDRRLVTLDTLADHIDHICQLAGSADHAAIGTDLDGGFGYPSIPYEMNNIGGLGKIRAVLAKRGYEPSDIAKICHANWQRILEKGAFQ